MQPLGLVFSFDHLTSALLCLGPSASMADPRCRRFSAPDHTQTLLPLLPFQKPPDLLRARSLLGLRIRLTLLPLPLLPFENPPALLPLLPFQNPPALLPLLPFQNPPALLPLLPFQNPPALLPLLPFQNPPGLLRARGLLGLRIRTGSLLKSCPT